MAKRKTHEDRLIDPARRRSVQAGPEELVRQHVISFLTSQLRVPVGLISVEKSIAGRGAPLRADIVVHSRDGRPWMIVECKAPDVPVSQQVFDQIAGYNRVIRARYLLVTNGIEHYCCEQDTDTGTMTYLPRLPLYPQS